MMHMTIYVFGLTALLVAASYSLIVAIAAIYWHSTGLRPSCSALQRPVTMLKPLCGDEPGLYENLRSFCVQDYANFQIVVGVKEPSDPAIPLVRRLMAEFPNIPIDLVIDPRLHGSNRKISSLINMLGSAKHELLLIADSDARVRPDYLASVLAPLDDESVGLVSCIYRSEPTDRICSRLGAMYVNEWYIPSVLLAWCFGHRGYVSGQTICLRKTILESTGGFASFANHLADDYQLGELVRKAGKRVVLARYVPDTVHDDRDLSSLLHHEVRWMRTIRVLKPRCFQFLFLTFSLPLALVGIGLVGGPRFCPNTAWALFSIVILSRLYLHFRPRMDGESRTLSDLWLIPIRDVLICVAWGKSLVGSRVFWRGAEFSLQPDGVMRPVEVNAGT